MDEVSSMSFVPSHATKFGPRIGNLILRRPTGAIEIQTPGLLSTSSRGVIPHLSIDHVHSTASIRWINISFESFLAQSPPLPTLQNGVHSLHKLLGFDKARHIVCMNSRDPKDVHEMPPNGNHHISVRCARGVRKLTTEDWRSYMQSCQPDFVLALSDTPFTPPPYSQRRLTRSIDRSLAWLAHFLHPPRLPSCHLLVHMAGDSNIPARRAFSEGLLETLHGKEAEAVAPLQRLDDGVAGYVFDLAPLRRSLLKTSTSASPAIPTTLDPLLPILQASLDSLPPHKLRLVNTTVTPHEILHLMQHVGIDLFDAHWAQSAADMGIALDFVFPVLPIGDTGPGRRVGGKWDLGHNLYEHRYADDFGRLAEGLLDGRASDASRDRDRPICMCLGCSPAVRTTQISHSSVDTTEATATNHRLPPYSRAYLHHLLQTHEMSAHSILVAHNLTVVDQFFAGARALLSSTTLEDLQKFAEEIEKFAGTYDDSQVLFEEAEMCWKEVDLARGKGRLAREKAKLKGAYEVETL